MAQVKQLRQLAVAFTDEQLVDIKDLAKAVAQIDADGIFANPETVRASLRMVDVEAVARADTQPALVMGFTAHHETKVYDKRISHFGSAYLYPKRTAILGLSIRLAQIAQGTLLRTADD